MQALSDKFFLVVV